MPHSLPRASHHEAHRSQHVGWLRAAVLGANDGLISTASLVVGMAAAGASMHTLLLTALVGLLGYGVSLVLFVLALRGLGTARAGAYFSTAPFIGAALALVLLGESTSPAFWLAGAFMALGVWLHLTEHHEHEHTHEPLAHTHRHVHDAHHQHPHDFAWEGTQPHAHAHHHAVVTHKHPHFPDIHHRHGH